MAHADFVHLHIHSEFSLLDGACRLDRLIEKACALNFPALAITDHGVLYGAMDFYKRACEAGIKPIIGCEVYVAPGSRFEKKTKAGGSDAYNHLVLLAKNFKGYQNLCKLVTAGFLEGFYYKPRVDKELLAAHNEGLIALSGCLAGEIPELIQNDQLDEARAAIAWYKDTFGQEDFYLELHNHNLPEQEKVNPLLLEFAGEFGLKAVATNDVHYLEKHHSHAHDCLICIGTQTVLADTKRMRYAEGQFYMRSAEEMKALFPGTPEVIHNTLEISEKCNLQIELGKLHYPVFHPPEGFAREMYLGHLLAVGLDERYGLKAHMREDDNRFVIDSIDDTVRLPRPPDTKESAGETDVAPTRAECAQAVIDRLHKELEVIEQTGFVSYFLIVGDFVQYGRSKGISCVARGSAAGSLVAYLLGISNVDPLQYGLLFERFLNPERVNPPDIDIDFADDRRAEVIEYTRRKYGDASVAQIITFGTLGPKSVVRDIGRVMGLSYDECDRLAKTIPNELNITLAQALEKSDEFRKAYENSETAHELIDTAFILEDLTRNASVHAAGVVIGDQPLVNVLPLKKEDDTTLVTQYSMGPVGDLGLLKMDFLGLKTLTVIRKTCEMIHAGRGTEIDIERIPLDDAATYNLLNKGNTVGVFQLESSGMRELCRNFQISSIEHITALIALYRPGPMDLIPEFIKRRHGKVKIDYAHPLLEPICRETYGIMVYQEQVMQAAQALAGYTLGGADILRRAMGKKKIEEMAKQREIFVQGCRDTNNIPQAKANEIFDLLEKFAGYGFNKSHAAAYALVAYQTAYLKTNYPIEFLSAMLTNDMDDTDKLATLINEAKSLGINVLGPDVNESQADFAPTPDKRSIRFGLLAIKGLGATAAETIVNARNIGGPFESLTEFCERVDTRAVNRRVMEVLIKSGACDGFNMNRASMYSQIDAALARGAGAAQDRQSGQASLFSLMEEEEISAPPLHADLPEWPLNELLTAEKELLGFYVTGHPLNPYMGLIKTYSMTDSSAIRSLPDRTTTRIGGLLESVQHGQSKKTGKPYAFAELEDIHGEIQVLFLNNNLETYQHLLTPGNVVLVSGEINNTEETTKMFASEIMRLTDAPAKLAKHAQIRFHKTKPTKQLLEQVKDLVSQHKGNCPLFLCVKHESGAFVFIEAHEQYRVCPSLELHNQIENLLGKNSFFVKIDETLPQKTARRWENKGKTT